MNATTKLGEMNRIKSPKTRKISDDQLKKSEGKRLQYVFKNMFGWNTWQSAYHILTSDVLEVIEKTSVKGRFLYINLDRPYFNDWSVEKAKALIKSHGGVLQQENTFLFRDEKDIQRLKETNHEIPLVQVPEEEITKKEMLLYNHFRKAEFRNASTLEQYRRVVEQNGGNFTWIRRGGDKRLAYKEENVIKQLVEEELDEYAKKVTQMEDEIQKLKARLFDEMKKSEDLETQLELAKELADLMGRNLKLRGAKPTDKEKELMSKIKDIEERE